MGFAILPSTGMTATSHQLAAARRYRIERYLTEGGMGAIYIGKKLGPGGFEKEVVLKQLLPEYTSRPGVPRPVLPRGEDLGDARPRQHRPHLRPGRVGRVAVHRHGVRARRRPAHDRPARASCAAASSRPAPRCTSRSRCWRASAYAHTRRDAERRVAGDHPPRRLAVEHPLLGAGRGEAVRLRHRQGVDALVGVLSRARQGRVHVARAGAQPADRSPHRSVLAGGVPVRGAHRRAAVRRRSEHAARTCIYGQPIVPPSQKRPGLPRRARRRDGARRWRPSPSDRYQDARRVRRGAAPGGAPPRPAVLGASAGRAPARSSWAATATVAAATNGRRRPGDPSTQKIPRKELEGKEAKSMASSSKAQTCTSSTAATW